MKDSIIIVGGFCETYELCREQGVPIKGVIDFTSEGCERYGIDYLGDDETFLAQHLDLLREHRLLITPDKPDRRRQVVAYYAPYKPVYASLRSPYAVVSQGAAVGDGCVVQAHAFLSAETRIGDFVRVNVGAKVMHHSVVCDYSTVAPSAVILGYVQVGEGAYIGANATILPRLRIGTGAIIGAGAVVTKNVQANSVVVGVPAYDMRGKCEE